MDFTSIQNLILYFFSDDFFSILAVIAVWGFFISGMDDLFIDIRYLIKTVLFSDPRNLIQMAEVEKAKEKYIAVMVPAWHEEDVIRAMLMRNVTNIDYINYHIFVGTYPNDFDTQREVDAVIEYYRRIRQKSAMGSEKEINGISPGDFIHKVVTPKPGPTNKADNLNAVYQRIKEVEKTLMELGEMDNEFEIYVMHDCEDVIHPKEFKLFSYLMTNKPKSKRPRNERYEEQFDFVQTPVFPLEVDIYPPPEEFALRTEAMTNFRWMKPSTWFSQGMVILLETIRLTSIWAKNLWRYAVSATYMDEFTEHHTKDMIVRRDINGLVPSAGVGTGLSRTMLFKLAEQTEEGKGIFNDIHLTEDYEIALHLKKLGAKQYFAVEPVRMRKYVKGQTNATYEDDEFIATKEFFPDELNRAIKQKTRWVMGITYQTMFPGKYKNTFKDFYKGWEGDFKTKYTLFRDRKALLTNYINILGYVIFIYCFVRIMQVEIYDAEWSYSNIFPAHSYIWWIVLFDTVVMVERFLQRFHATRKIYGLKQAFYFLLRNFLIIGLFLGNIINFMATAKATWRYIKFSWEKRFGPLPTKPAKKEKTEEEQEEKDGEEGEAQQAGEVEEESEEPKLQWGKTDHVYLSEDQMREYVNPLGQLALRSRLINHGQLEEALGKQRESGLPLGQVFRDMGILDDIGFSYLYSQQLAMPMKEIDPLSVSPEAINVVPEEVSEEFDFVPMDIDQKGVLIIAVSGPMDEYDRKRLESKLGRRIRLVITFQTDIQFSRRRAYGRIAAEKADGRGQKEQKEGRFVRLGVWLMKKELLGEKELQQGLYLQKQQQKPLGEVLLDMGVIEEAHLDEYFSESPLKMNFRRIAAEMVDQKLLETYPKIFCSLHRVIPFRQNEATVTFGTSNPAARDLIEQYGNRQEKKSEVFLAPDEDITNAIEYCYGRLSESARQLQLLGSRLVASKVLDEDRLAEALRHQKETKRRLGEILVSYGYCDELSFLSIYSDEIMLPVVNLFPEKIEAELSYLLPHVEASRLCTTPVSRDDTGLITFALAYDFKDEDLQEIRQRFTGLRINFVLALKTKIRESIHVVYVEKAKSLKKFSITG